MGVGPQTLQVVGTGAIPPDAPAHCMPPPSPQALYWGTSSTSHWWLMETIPSFLPLRPDSHSVPWEHVWKSLPGGLLMNNLGTLLHRVCHTLLWLVSQASQLISVSQCFHVHSSSEPASGPRPRAARKSVGYMRPINVRTTAYLLFCAAAACTKILPARN